MAYPAVERTLKSFHTPLRWRWPADFDASIRNRACNVVSLVQNARGLIPISGCRGQLGRFPVLRSRKRGHSTPDFSVRIRGWCGHPFVASLAAPEWEFSIQSHAEKVVSSTRVAMYILIVGIELRSFMAGPARIGRRNGRISRQLGKEDRVGGRWGKSAAVHLLVRRPTPGTECASPRRYSPSGRASSGGWDRTDRS
jgi:hypothetical protein